jgi:hypothetical protein
MKLRSSRRALGAITVAAAYALTARTEAQQTPADSTSPAGSGGASNAALIQSSPTGPTPRLPSGKPDFSGVWVGGGPVGDIREGLLAGEEIKLKPEAERLMKSRMAADDPEALCLPTGVPRVAPYPWRIVQTPAVGEPTHLYFLFEGNIHSFRQIFMDGRSHPEDLELTWYGHSIGRWDGDTLVIETVGFNDKFWFDFVGHPHSTQLKTIERYTRTNEGTLENVTTIIDPGAYEEPFTVKYTATLRPGWDLMEYICNENNQDVEHIRGPAGL